MRTAFTLSARLLDIGHESAVFFLKMVWLSSSAAVLFALVQIVASKPLLSKRWNDVGSQAANAAKTS